MYVLLGILLLFGVAFVLYVELFPFPFDVDMHNLQSARSNAYKILGSLLGCAVLYFLDTRFWHYETKAPLLAQVLKILVGAVVVLSIKSLLKAPLLSLFGGHEVANGVRYFLLFAVAGVCPVLFPYFTRFALFLKAKFQKTDK